MGGLRTHIFYVLFNILWQAKEEAISLQDGQGIPGGVSSGLALQNPVKDALSVTG